LTHCIKLLIQVLPDLAHTSEKFGQIWPGARSREENQLEMEIGRMPTFCSVMDRRTWALETTDPGYIDLRSSFIAQTAIWIKVKLE